MRYEIISGTEGMFVLVLNSRVILITEHMDEITDTISNKHADYLNKNRKPVDTVVKEDEKPANDALGKLFGL